MFSTEHLFALLYTVLGGLITAMVLNLHRAIINFFTQPIADLYGEWFVHFIIDDSDGNVHKVEIPATLTIRRGVVNKYRVKYRDEIFTYQGIGYAEGTNFCVNMRKKGGTITTHHRYACMHSELNNLCYGVWTSIGNNDNIACGAVVIEKKAKNVSAMPLTTEKLRAVLANRYKADEEWPFMHIRTT